MFQNIFIGCKQPNKVQLQTVKNKLTVTCQYGSELEAQSTQTLYSLSQFKIGLTPRLYVEEFCMWATGRRAGEREGERLEAKVIKRRLDREQGQKSNWKLCRVGHNQNKWPYGIIGNFVVMDTA